MNKNHGWVAPFLKYTNDDKKHLEKEPTQYILLKKKSIQIAKKGPALNNCKYFLFFLNGVVQSQVTKFIILIPFKPQNIWARSNSDLTTFEK